MGEKIGATTVDIEWVLVHPTSLVKPDFPDAEIMFLAAESFRGVGGRSRRMGSRTATN